MGNHKQAIEDYNKALRLDESAAAVYNNRGISREAIGDKQGAIEDYKRDYILIIQFLKFIPNLELFM